MNSPGLLISAPASDTGKTTLTLGLARAFRNRGLSVQCFKNGPDYIDTQFHALACGRQSVNLDSWAMPHDMLLQEAARGDGADLVVAEGSMGLFDGVSCCPHNSGGSSADLASLMGWPVVLVVKPDGQGQTAAAVAKGIALFRADVVVAGVILNQVGSARHASMIRGAMEDSGIRVFGALPRGELNSLPKRHLGLVQASELPSTDELIDQAAKLVEKCVDINGVLSAANSSRHGPVLFQRFVSPPGNRIALARDAAFSFMYEHLLEAWHQAGAAILPFSPLGNEAPDPSADVCWLPGGYPELHVQTLSVAEKFINGLRQFSQTKAVHGECGGYMVMGKSIIGTDGIEYPMAGILGLQTSFESRKLHLGYRAATLHAAIPGYPSGSKIRGHEFHYASTTFQPDPPLASVVNAYGDKVAESGSHRALATGTFCHLIA